MLKMIIRPVGNPDFGQDPTKPPYGVPHTITITASTAKELADKAHAAQDEYDLGGGNWGEPQVYQDDKLLGYMSFNGRFWTGRHPNTNEIIL